MKEPHYAPRVVNYAPRVVNYAPRVMLQIVASLSDDSQGVIYDRNMFIVQATLVEFYFRLSGRK